MLRLAAIGLLVAACSGGGNGAARDAHHPTTPARPADKPTPVADAGPSEHECDQLLHHAIDVIATPDVSAADREATAAAMRDRFLAGCRTLTRAKFACAAASKTLDDMLACDGEKRAGLDTVGPHDRMPER